MVTPENPLLCLFDYKHSVLLHIYLPDTIGMLDLLTVYLIIYNAEVIV